MIASKRTHIQRYRGRRFNPRAEVWVYRNLNMSGTWYSVMQGNRVIGHTEFAAVRAPRFVVQEAGRKRALTEGVKNVHAFVVGTLSYTELFFGDKLYQLRHRAGYLPELGHFWVDYKSGWIGAFREYDITRFGMESAGFALLSKDGLSVDEPKLK